MKGLKACIDVMPKSQLVEMSVVVTCASRRSRGWWKAQACVLLDLIHEVSAALSDLPQAFIAGRCRAC